MSGYGVRVDGWAVGESFDVTDLAWSTRWQPAGGSGCWDASWSMALSRAVLPPTWLRRGAIVDLYDGMTRFWSGILDMPERGEDGDTLNLTAHGLCREEFRAWDASYAASTTPSVAVAAAIGRGWQIAAGSGIATTALATQDTQQLNTIADLLDAQIDGSASRWTIGAGRVLNVAAPPTVPVWRVAEDVALFGAADDDWLETGALRYYDSTQNKPLTVHFTNTAAQTKFGHSEAAADITGLGPMTAADALTKVTNAVGQRSGRMGFTNALNVGLADLTTLAGTPVRASQVQAGQMVRGFGFNDPTTLYPAQAIDFVAGEVRCTADGDSVYLAPQGMVSRGFMGFIEDQVASEDQLADFAKGITG